jgi:hypothetical protein
MSTCNLCWPLCQCGAEALLGPQRNLTPAEADAYMDCLDSLRAPSRARLLRDAARWPELEEMERTLANYGEAK